MALNKAQMMQNADYILQDMRVQVVYDGRTAFATEGMVEIEQSVETIGLLTDYRKSIWLRPVDFNNTPFKPNTLITIDGTEYRILPGGQKDPAGVLDRIDVGHVNS